jgi:hypothetical protein
MLQTRCITGDFGSFRCPVSIQALFAISLALDGSTSQVSVQLASPIGRDSCVLPGSADAAIVRSNAQRHSAYTIRHGNVSPLPRDQ